MLLVNKHKDILLEEFYLDDDGTVRRSRDGYLGRFSSGDKARTFIANGYRCIQIPRVRRSMKFSHLVLLLHGVPIPDDKVVDHIDMNKLNDHLSNLRMVSSEKNNKNRPMRVDNTSGVTGVSWHKHQRKWQIRRTVNGNRITKYSECLEEAKVILAELTKQCGKYTSKHGQ